MVAVVDVHYGVHVKKNICFFLSKIHMSLDFSLQHKKISLLSHRVVPFAQYVQDFGYIWEAKR